jgi:hypothetical protein
MRSLTTDCYREVGLCPPVPSVVILTRDSEVRRLGAKLTVNGLAAEVPFARASKEAAARQGRRPRLTACLVTARLIIRHSTQTDTQRFSLPFNCHLRKITEAPISACAPADGTRRKCW